MDYIYMSQKGYDELKEKLEYFTHIKRIEIANDIARAREKGDLSENAEYHAAKEEQSIIETKILQLEDDFARARVMDNSLIDTSKAIMLSFVTIRNTKTDMKITYQLVSHAESNVKEKKISIESPIGDALLSTEEGDVVKVKIPAGVVEFEVLKITHE